MPKNASRKTGLRLILAAAAGVALILPVMTMAQVPDKEEMQMMPRHKAFPGDSYAPTTKDKVPPR